MRKGFEGLSALVGTVLNEEVKSGALFAFSNRRRTTWNSRRSVLIRPARLMKVGR
jgi:hypothetical protein